MPQQLTPAELADLKAEMRRDGQWIRAQLQAREAALPLDLPIWVSKTPYIPEKEG